MANYRKIWEKANGPIPVDEKGCKYEIHHIDGDRENNHLSNLMCVTIEEHFRIHFNQGDWGAAFRVAQRMGIDPKIKSELMSLSNKRRLKNGNHPFQDKDIRADNLKTLMEKIHNNTHPFQKPEVIQKAVKAKQEKYSHEQLSEQTKKGWSTWKKNNPNVDRTTKGSRIGADKIRGTRWYHKLDGSQLRTSSDDPRIIKEGWMKGRFGGKELSIKANNCKLNKNNK